MDSEALLPDQTTDGVNNSMKIVEEKTIVSEKHLNQLLQQNLHELVVATEPEAATDQAIPESVVDCSKMPSSASEKQDRSEEVDSFSVAVDASSTEEVTNKTIEIVKDEIEEGFEDENAELERPMDSACPAKEVTAANGKLEVFPVESDSAKDEFAISSREEQAIATVVEAKDLEAESSDLNKEVGVHVEEQVATQLDSVTSAILKVEEQVPIESNFAEIAEETREVEAKLEDEREVSSAIVNVEESREAEQVSTESIVDPSAAAVVEETREMKAKLEDGKELPSVIVDAEELTDDNQETTTNVGEHVPTESIFATSVGAVAQENREIEAKLEDESNVSLIIVNAEGTIEAEAELITDDNHETSTNVEKQVPTESIFTTSTIAVAEETREIEAKFEDEKKVSSTIANVEGTTEAEAELTDDNHEITKNVDEQVPTESIFATSTIPVAEETREIEAKLEDEKKVSSTIANVEVTTEEADLTNGRDETTTSVEEHVPTESIFASSTIAVAEETREIEAKLEDEKKVSSTIANVEVTTEEADLTNGSDETTSIEEHVPTESIFASSTIAVAEETRGIEAKLEDEKKVSSTIATVEVITEEADLTNGSDETTTSVEEHVPTESIFATSTIVVAEETREIEAKLEDEKKVSLTTEAEVELIDSSNEVATSVEKHVPTESIFATSVGAVAQETREIEAKLEDEKEVSPTIFDAEGTTEVESQFTDDNHEMTINVEEQIPTESIFAVSEEMREMEAKLEDEKEVPSTIVNPEGSTKEEVELADGNHETTTNVEEHVPTESIFSSSAIAVIEETRELEAKLEDEKEVGTEADLQVPTDSCSATSAIGTANGIVELEAKIADSIELVANEVEKQVPVESVADSSSAKIVEESKEIQDRVEQQVSSDFSIATSAIGPFEETKEKELIVDDHEVSTDVEKQALSESSDATLAISIAEEARETEAKIEKGKKEATEIEEIDSSNYTTSDAGVAEETEGLVSVLVDDHQKVLKAEEKQIQAEETTEIAAKTEDVNTKVETEVEHQFSSDSTSSATAPGVAEKTEEIEAKFVDNSKELITEAKKHIATDNEEKEATIEVPEQVPSDSSTSASANGIAEETERLEFKLIEDDGEVPAEVEKQVQSEESTDLGAELGDDKTEIETEVEQQFSSDSINPTSTTGVNENFGGIEAELAVDSQEVITESENQIEIATEISDVTLAVVTSDEARHDEDKIVNDEKETTIEVQEQVPSDSSTSASANGISEETSDREVLIEDEKKVPNEESTEVGAKLDDGVREVETEVLQQFPSDSTSPTSAIGIAEKSTEIEAVLTNDNQEEDEKQDASETTDVTLAAVTAEEFRQIEDDEKEAAVEVQEQVPSDSSTSNEFGKFVDDEKETVVEVQEQVPSNSSTCASANGISEETERLESKHIDDDREAPAEAEKQVPRDESTDVEVKIDDGETEVESEAERQLPSESTNPTSVIGIDEKSIEIEAEHADDKQEENTEAEKQDECETSDVTLSAVTAEEFRQIEDDEKEAAVEVQEQIPSDSSTSSQFGKIEDDEKEAAVEVQEQVPSDSSTSNEFGKFVDDEKETVVEVQEQVPSNSSTCASANGISEETERLESKHIDDDREAPAEAEKQVPREESTDVEAKIDDGETEVESEVERQLPSESTNPTSVIGIDEKSIEIEAEHADDKQEENTEAEKQVECETSDVTLSAVTAEEFRQIEDDEKEAAVEVPQQIPSDSSTSSQFGKIEDDEKEAAVEVQEQVPSDSSTSNEFYKFAEIEKETAIEDQKQVLSDSSTCASANGISEETERLESKHIDDDREVLTEAEKQVSKDESTDVDNGETEVESEVEQQLLSDSNSSTSVIGIAEKSIEIEAELADDKQEEKTEAEKQVASETSDVPLSAVTAEVFRQIEDDEKEAAVEVQEQIPFESSASSEFGKIEDDEKEAAVEVQEQVPSDSSTFASASGILEETEGLESKHINDDQEVPAEAEKQVQSNKSTEVGATLDDGETQVETEAEQQFPSDSTASPTSAIGITEKSVEIEAELSDDKLEAKTEAEKQVASEKSDVTLAVVSAEELRQTEDDEKEETVEVQEQITSDSSTPNEFEKNSDNEKETEIEVEEQVPSDSSTSASASGILEETERQSKDIDDVREVPIEAEKQVPSEESIEVGAKLDNGETEVETEAEQQFPSDSASPISTIGIAEKSMDIEAELAYDKQEVITEAEKQVASEIGDVTLAPISAEEFRQTEDVGKEATVVVQEQVPSDSSTFNEFKEIVDNEKETAVEVEEQVPSDSSTSTSVNGISEEIERQETKHIDDDREVPVEAAKQVPSDESTEVGTKLDNGETEVETEVEQQLPSDSTSPTSAIEFAEKSVEIESELADDKQEVKTEAAKQVASETGNVTLVAIITEEFRQIEDDGKEATVEVQEQVSSDSSTFNEFEKIKDDEKKAAVEIHEQVPSDSSTSASASGISDETESLESKAIDDDLYEPAEAEKQVPSKKSIEAGSKLDDGKIEVETEKRFPSDSTSPTSVFGIVEKSIEIEAELADDKYEVKKEAEKQDASETSDVTLVVVAAEAFEQIEDDKKEATVEVQKLVPSDSSSSNEFGKIVDDEKETTLEVQEEISSDSTTCTSPDGIAKETKRLESKLIDDDLRVPAEAEKQIPSDEFIETEVEQQFPSDATSATSAMGIADKSGEFEAELEDDDKQEVESEVELADDKQEVITEAENQVASETGDVTLAVVTTADEVGKTEAKIEDDEKEAAVKVQEQVQSDFGISTSADKIVEETIKLEPKLTDDDQVVLKEDAERILVEESTDIGAKVEDGIEITEKPEGIEAELADESQDVITEAENQVATEANEATLAVVTADEVGNNEVKVVDDVNAAVIEVQGQVPSDSSISASADRISVEDKKLEPKLIGEDRVLLTEAEKQIAIEEFTKIGAKVEDGKAEVESEVEQQFPSDSGTPTSAIGIAVKTREIDAELADKNWEMPREVATELNDSASVMCTSDDVRETKAEIEGGEEVVTEVGEQIPIDSGTSSDGTTEDAKEPEVKLVDDNQEAAADVGEQGLNESRSDILAVESALASASGISDEAERLESKAIDDDLDEPAEADKQIPSEKSIEAGSKLDDGKTEVETETEQPFPSDSTSPTSVIRIVEKSIEIEAELADDKYEVKNEAEKQDASETSDVALVVVAAEAFKQIEDDKKEATVEVQKLVPSDSSSSNEFGKNVDDEKETTIEVQEEISSDSTTCTSADGIAKETKRLESKLIDDDLRVPAEAEKQIPSEEFIETGDQIYNGKAETETEVEQQFSSDATSATSAMGIADKSGEIEAELEDDDKQEVEPEVELADDKQEVITEDENQVASETSDVTLAVDTAEEFRNTEAKIEDNEKEAAVEAQEQVPNDSSTSEDTKKLEAELTDDVQVVQLEDAEQIPVEDSTEVRTKVEDGRTEVESEVEKQFPMDSVSPTVIETTEKTREIEDELAGENQEAITVAEKQVASETIGVALAVVTTADEVGKTEAKIEDVEKEEAVKVQEQVQNDFGISTSADKIVEETLKLEPKLIDEDQVVLKEDAKRIPVEESTGIEITEKSEEIEAELADESQDVITEAENQVATEASEATLAVVTADEVGNNEVKVVDDVKAAAIEVQGHAPSDSSISTSADRISVEDKKLEPKLIGEDRVLLTEAEKQIAIEGFTKMGAKVEDGKAEVESEVKQQFPSDSGTPTSAIGIAVKTREIDAELADKNWEMPREVATELNDSASVMCTSDDVKETKAEIEGGEEVVTEVGEQIPIDSGTSSDGTTEDAKESEVKLADDNQEAAADVGEQGLNESRSDILAVESALASASGISDEAERLESKAIDDDLDEPAEADKQIPSEKSIEAGSKLDDGKTEVETETEQPFPSDSTSPTSVIRIVEKSIEIEAELADDKYEVKNEAEKQDASETSDVALVVVAAEAFKQIEDDKKEATVEVQKLVPSDSSSSNEFGKNVDDEKETTIEVQEEISSDSTTCTSADGIAKETKRLESKLTDDDLRVPAEAEKQIPSEEFIETGDQIYNGKAETETEVEQQFSSDATSATSAMGIADKSGEIEAELEDDDNQEVEPEVELADDKQEVITEAENQVASETSDVTLAVDTAEEFRNTEAKIEDNEKEAAVEAQEQVPNDSSTSEDTKKLEAVLTDDVQVVQLEDAEQIPVEDSTEVRTKIEDGRTEVESEVEKQFPMDSVSPSVIEITEKTREIEDELADENQEVITVAEKQVASGTIGVALVVVTTADEVGKTEAKIEDVEKEAIVKVQEQVQNDFGISTSADKIVEETLKLEPKLIDEDQVVLTEDAKQIPVEESTGIGAKVEDGIEITEKSEEIEAELADESQDVITEAENQVATEASDATLAVVTADEVGNNEVKVVDDVKEAAIEVQGQVPSDSCISTSDDRISEEDKKLEPELIGEDRVLLTEADKQIAIEEFTKIGTKVEDGKAEVESEVEQQFPSDSGTPTSAIGIAVKTREIDAELADENWEMPREVATKLNDSTSVICEDRVLLTEAEKQIAIDEFTKIGAKVEDGKAEVESEVEQQFPSDSGSPTSAIGIAVKTREIDAELADKNWEMPREVATELNDSASVMCTSDDVRETKAEIEGGEEVVTEDGEQIPIDSGTSSDGTTEDAKQPEVKLADDNQEAASDVGEEGLIESRSDILAVESAEESRKTEAELEDKKQEAAPEVKKQELNRRNEADPANDIGQVLNEEERDNETFYDTSDNANDTKLKIVDLVKEDGDNNRTSIVQTADEISQATIEVKNEKQDELTQIEEPSVAEINKIDSGYLIVGLSTREEKPDVIIESVDKEEDILEDKVSMDNLNDANVICQVPESTVETVKDCRNDEMVREIDDHSQIVKDMDIEMKEDTIALVESSNNLDNDTETNDGFEGKESSEGLEIVERKKEDILKVDKVILDENSKDSYVPDSTESSTKIEKSPDVVEVIEQNDGEILESSNTSSAMIGSEVAEEQCEDSAIKNITTDETAKSAGEEGDASNNLAMENKISEDKEEKESKDESVKGDYIKVAKDIDVSEEVATTITALDESLSPKSADFVKVEEESPKDSAPAKSSPRRSNNIISKVKHQIVKAKKAIMGKSPSPKDTAPKSKELK